MFKEGAIIHPATSALPAPPVVRRLPPQKARRLRIAWFILGMFSGMLCTSIAQWAGNEEQTVADAPPLALEQQGKLLPPSPVPKQRANASHFVLTVGRGDTLIDMLTGKGVDYKEAHNIVAAVRKHYNPRKLVIGQEVELHLNKQKNAQANFDVSSLRIKLSSLSSLLLKQPEKDSFHVEKQQAALNNALAGGGGKITTSLYQTGIDNGVPPTILASLINAYSYDIDFQRDIRRGDSFNVLFETLKTEDDTIAGYGKLLYASFNQGGREKRIYHFTRPSGEEGFFTTDGTSVRKALLRTPVNGARLSSGYGMRRHPILGYSRMHKGVDFAAPTGTPVYASGDGIVEYAGRRGSYGNYVLIRHNNTYSSAYAHLSKIRIRKNIRVKQGTVIGYVGTTGASTGPHLHYEILAHGKQVDPKSIRTPTGYKLEGRELASFRENIKQINLMAARVIHNQPTLAAKTSETSKVQ